MAHEFRAELIEVISTEQDARIGGETHSVTWNHFSNCEGKDMK